jgi:GH15 family glucan-1,4-alpha-glucosidase
LAVTLPIADYAIIGDLHTAAVVGRDGSVDWLCLPRFDSGACFAALVGTEEHGFWRLAPESGGLATRRRYRENTLILEQEWDTTEGSVRVVDFMPPASREHDIVRIVEGLSGSVRMRSALRLRFDYGRSVPWMHRINDQTVGVVGPDAVALAADVPMYGHDLTTLADFTIEPGQRLSFVLTWYPSHTELPVRVDPVTLLDHTQKLWVDWASRCTYDGPYKSAVVRSLITLKALTYAPTGGIVAAPTTSLPEELGGVRNWDYRYCWLRDAAFTLDALVRGGYIDEAHAWRDWLVRAVGGNPDDLQIMYGVAGERRLLEHELPWLPGYANSRPVRVGNKAAEQLQLDVYGEVVDALTRGRAYGLPPLKTSWELQRHLLRVLSKIWHEPDEGIWEIRGARRDFVHSKVMAWVAVDRMIAAGDEVGHDPAELAEWRELREHIHEDVCVNGFDTGLNSFTQYYGASQLDAALLRIPLVGFLPPDDPRVIGTVDAIRRELSADGGFLLRYPHAGTPQPHSPSHADVDRVDGLPGGEGVFVACSFWLVEALHVIGRKDEARELYERLLDRRNDVGLLSEELDPKTGQMLGNFPQAFSHVPLVTAAYLLAEMPGPPTGEG